MGDTAVCCIAAPQRTRPQHVMSYSLQQAATAGLNKSTVLRAIKPARFQQCATKKSNGRLNPPSSIVLYPPVAAPVERSDATQPYAPGGEGKGASVGDPAGGPGRGKAIRRDRDAWRDQAQRLECFAVAITQSSLGSILIDKCTGKTWLLGRSSSSRFSTAIRWFPITTDTNEPAGENLSPR